MIHSFDIDDAVKYGMTEAVILYNLRFWIEKNKANNKHFHDGRYWTYNSVKAFEELFPYLTYRNIRSAIEKLEKLNVIITGNFNQSSYDRTRWFALFDLPILTNGIVTEGKTVNTDIKQIEPLSSKPDLISVLQYLNEKTNRDFQPVPANLKLIEARLKEGGTVEKCKQVIDAKVAEWINDKKMVEYLRPSTLFNATNFAQYVGQLPKNAQVKREWQEGERNGDLIYEKYIGWRKLNRIELLAEQKAKEAAGLNDAGN